VGLAYLASIPMSERIGVTSRSPMSPIIARDSTCGGVARAIGSSSGDAAFTGQTHRRTRHAFMHSDHARTGGNFESSSAQDTRRKHHRRASACMV
jgi:hypothetical protein